MALSFVSLWTPWNVILVFLHRLFKFCPFPEPRTGTGSESPSVDSPEEVAAACHECSNVSALCLEKEGQSGLGGRLNFWIRVFELSVDEPNTCE